MKTLKFDTYTKVYTRSLRSILWKKIHVTQKNSDYIENISSYVTHRPKLQLKF